LRAGFLTSAARRGASVFKMRDVSRHKSMDVLQAYVRDADLFRDHAGAGLPERQKDGAARQRFARNRETGSYRISAVSRRLCTKMRCWPPIPLDQQLPPPAAMYSRLPPSLAGLTSTAIRTVLGTSSCRNPNRKNHHRVRAASSERQPTPNHCRQRQHSPARPQPAQPQPQVHNDLQTTLIPSLGIIVIYARHHAQNISKLFLLILWLPASVPAARVCALELRPQTQDQ
jgi:hypothetical protein